GGSFALLFGVLPPRAVCEADRRSLTAGRPPRMLHRRSSAADFGGPGGPGRSAVKDGPGPSGFIPSNGLGVALLGVKPRCAGAVWIGEPPLCCTRIGTHASLLSQKVAPD